MRVVATVVITLLIVGAFMAVDRSVLHWYTPQPLSADDIALTILGDWDRSVPQAERARDNYSVLRESIGQPGPGSAVQLQRALVRTANAAALPLIGPDLAAASSERAALERLNQCVEFLLGLSGSTVACNLAPISP